MHKDLIECIETAKKARDGVLDKSLSVKEANAIAANNHTVTTAHLIDLRERMFAAEGTRIPTGLLTESVKRERADA